MRNDTKKIISTALLLFAMLATLTSCAKELKCDRCYENVKSEEHVIEILGENSSFCNNCYKDWKLLLE